MDYHKPSNYVRSCLLFGCLFSFNALLDLSSTDLVHAEDAVYLYQVAVNDGGQGTAPVDPLNPDATVIPVPPSYDSSEEGQEIEKKEPEKFSVLPPDGKKPLRLPSEPKKYKPVYKKKPKEAPDLVVALNGEGQNQSLGGGQPPGEHSYLGEMFGVLSGKMLYGSDGNIEDNNGMKFEID